MAWANDAEVAKLICRVATGDRIAFGLLHATTKPIVSGVCSRILRDPREVEDTVQEVYLKVWRSAGTFQAERQTTIAWLCTIARRQSFDVARTSKRQPAIREGDYLEYTEAVDPGLDPEVMLLRVDDHRSLSRVLARLTPARADAVRGAYLNEQSYAELAAKHGVPLNTMRTWLRRSLIEMRGFLLEERRDDLSDP